MSTNRAAEGLRRMFSIPEGEALNKAMAWTLNETLDAALAHERSAETALINEYREALQVLERTANAVIVRLGLDVSNKELEERLLELTIAADHARDLLDAEETPYR